MLFLKKVDFGSNKDWLLTAALFVVLAVLTFFTAHNIIYGYIALAVLVSIPFAWGLTYNIQIGFAVFTFLNFFLFTFYRLIPIDFPWGTMVENLAVILLLLVFIKRENRKENLFKQDFYNPITYTAAVYAMYGLLEVFNPSATAMSASLYAIKGMTFNTIVPYLVAYFALSSFQYTVKYIKLLILFMSINAIYAFHQEYVGLFDFEWHWVRSVPERFDLLYIWGNMRKWSLQSDVATFGILMGMGSIFCTVMATAPLRFFYKITLLFLGLLMMVAMTFSGTRAAFAMIPAGFVLFLLFNLNNLKILVACVLALLIGLIVYFGPFYSPQVMRFRSTFELKDDASLNVRDINRKKVQPYIWSHPIGGGVYTTGVEGAANSPGHPLAGFPPDSTFLLQALEKGYIGLAIFVAMLITTMWVGVNNYFKSTDPFIRTLYLALLCSFLATSLAAYAQPNFNQKPLGLINIFTQILMFKLIIFDKHLSENKNLTLKKIYPKTV